MFASFILLTLINCIKSSAETEKQNIAEEQIERERQLNEYLAHEVRNPLSSAISALSFVAATTNESVEGQDTKVALLRDIKIADSSLQYINELLRSMLDINRCAQRKIVLDNAPADLLRDILQPTAAILCTRGAKVDIEVDCPSDIVITTDRLRLKQILVNLAMNATKFVVKGFISLRAEVVDGSVVIYVEDSGPGVPSKTKETLFRAFQESFDLLSQGTGIGLYVCRHLSGLMGATISLDEDYTSGVEGCPGARFVIDLHQPPSPLEYETSSLDLDETDRSLPIGSNQDVNLREAPTIAAKKALALEKKASQYLHENLTVLFVDDDLVLRKLFMRTLHKVAPTWTLHEACSGESALLTVDEKDFDIIFMDQYMPGIERPLLGTETVRLMRIKGVDSTICGLSANDIETEYVEAGADAFMLKPFPCEKQALREQLMKVLTRGEERKELMMP